MYPVNPDWGEYLIPNQAMDEPGDRFEAQVGDVGDIVPSGQDDSSFPIGQKAHQFHDASDCLASAQGDKVGGTPLGVGQRVEQGSAVGLLFTRPRYDQARG